MVLWAMSLWMAALILCTVGFGQKEFQRYGVNLPYFLIMGLAIWVLGWLSSWVWPPFWRVNLGFAGLGILAWLMVALARKGRWRVIALFLCLIATLARMVAPLSLNEASVLPDGAIESVGLGLSAGLIVGQGAPSALVAACAESLSAFLISMRHVHHILGRHDLALVILASLSAWLAGWLTSTIGTRLGRPAA